MLKSQRAIFGLVFGITLSFVPHISLATDDPSLFEKDGFRIHYVGNGGNCTGCEWIAIEGQIPAEAGQYLNDFMSKNKLNGIKLYVSLDSLGGSLVGGLRLGRVIRSLHLNTKVGKTVPNERWYTEKKGSCYSACAYAFLGGVNRIVNAGEYGVHQFYTDALLKTPEGKVFTPIDFSQQQTLTGLLLSYVIEMGANAELVIEANKTPPTEINTLTEKQLLALRVKFDPEKYTPWSLEAFRNGLVIYSRSEDENKQITIFCADGGRQAELLIAYKEMDHETLEYLQRAFAGIQKFQLLKNAVFRADTKLKAGPKGATLTVPLQKTDLDALEADRDPYGSFQVHLDEPHVYYNAVYEGISLENLGSSIKLMRRNCIN